MPPLELTLAKTAHSSGGTDVTVNAGPGVAHKYSGGYTGVTVCDHGEAADVRAACTGDWTRVVPSPAESAYIVVSTAASGMACIGIALLSITSVL